MTDFRINVVVDPAKAKAGIKGVKRELTGVEKAADDVRRSLRRAFTIGGIALATRQVTSYADSYTNLQNRIRTVTESQEELANVTEKVFQIADDTRSAFDSTVEVYARTALAARDLGRSQEELLAFTESLNQAVILSGAASEEARNGLIQLSQGIASGALRGDELRSVLEQLPVVADVIAKSLGVTRGELRQLGADGKISAEIVLDAFREAREELDERFAKSVPTVGQAFVVLRNNAVELIGELDQSTGASGLASQAILGLGENLDVAAVAAVATGTAILAGYVPATLTASTATAALFTRLSSVRVLLASNPFALAVGGLTAAGFAASAYADRLREAEQATLRAVQAGADFELTEFGKVGEDILRLSRQLEILDAAIARTEAGGGQANAGIIRSAERLRGELADLGVQQEALRNGTARTTEEAQEQVEVLNALARAVERNVTEVERENTLLGLNSREREVQAELLGRVAALRDEFGRDASPEQAAELEAVIRRNQALREQADVLDLIRGPQEQFETQLTSLQTLLEAGTITSEEFARGLALITEQAGGLDFSNLDLDLSVSGGLSDLPALLEAQREQLRLESERQRVLDSLADPLAELEQRQRIITQLYADGIIAVDQYNRGVEETAEAIRLLNPEYALQRRLLEEIRGPQQSLVEGTAALDTLLAQDLITLDEYNAKLAELRGNVDALDTSLSGGITSGLQKVGEQLQDIGSLSEAAIVNGFNSAEDALVQFATTGQVNFASFAQSISADISRIFARLLLLNSIEAFGGGGFFGLGGGAPGIPGIGGSASGGDFAAGDVKMVGEKGPEMVQFGLPGKITPADQTAAALANAGGGRGGETTVVQAPAPAVNLSVVNVDSPEAAREAMASPEGAQVLLNQVRANRDAFRSALNS